MERLTQKAPGCFKYNLANHKPIPGEFGTYEAFYDYSMATKKLGEYEDAEEQGFLLRLPCRVGDTVYRIWKVDGRESVISTHCFDTVDHIVEWLDKFGKTVFLTIEEAEVALEKDTNVSIKGENNG